MTIKQEQKKTDNGNYVKYFPQTGARGGAVVEALRYKPEGRGIDFRWCLNFSLT
jgi:hypothetical protein